MFKQIFVFISIFYISVYSQNDCDGIIGAAEDSSFIVSIYLKEDVVTSGGAKASGSNSGSIFGSLGAATKISESAKVDSATNVATKTSNSIGKLKINTKVQSNNISWIS